ncbi:MAG TPA: hypothetical protein PK725_09545 [Rhodocyclaceae bacterium]|jgi:heme O synthase-like polyprenyltransferase|nr:hypothetical protein [Rhodocyclaceae bacterium]HRQ47182.1 hypothetical protein [Rhodocyclaceae bacterium]
MLFVRLFALLALIGVGGSLVAWMLTGNARYREWAWRFFQVGIATLLVFLVLFAIERVIAPL